MFTCCPACETTFRLGADDLRRAQGRVRCGECSTVFNALQFLAEDPEKAARPGSWLQEPANDAMSPAAAVNFSAAAANDEQADTEQNFDEGPEIDTEELETAIFVTDPEGDTQYYRTRTFNVATTGTGEDSRGESAFDTQPHITDPVQTAGTQDDDNAEFSALLDSFEDIALEADSAERWNEARQQHEQAESGLELTGSFRTDLHGTGSSTDADDGADLDITQEQPALRPGPDNGVTNPEEDFDDTIWERIPGVGSYGDSLGRPIEVAPLRSPWKDDPASPKTGASEPEDSSDDDALEFNAPEETWSKIFVRGPAVTDDDDNDDAYPKLYADEPDTDTGSDADDERAQLERIFDPERIAAAMQERIAARNESGIAPHGFASPDAFDGSQETSDQEDPERQDAIAVWLTEEEPGTAIEIDEPPDEGYDVQHIILADETDSAPARDFGTPKASAGELDAPRWRNEASSEPRRSGLWLWGGILLMAALGLQLLHYNRDSLATSPMWGGALTDAYALLGMDIFPAWSMGDYEIRSAEAVTGESGPDIMDIRAQIAVTGSAATGYPYLRIVLSDRWSKPVAEKTFAPADYAVLPKSPGEQLLQPGQTVEAHVSIVDPGAGAQGFELELCLPRRHTGMECTGQPFK